MLLLLPSVGLELDIELDDLDIGTHWVVMHQCLITFHICGFISPRYLPSAIPTYSSLHMSRAQAENVISTSYILFVAFPH